MNLLQATACLGLLRGHLPIVALRASVVIILDAD